ncbi:MAG: group III truncated hemoglobin [Nitratireductor sp.]
MTSTQLRASPIHLSIDEEQIGIFVEDFYLHIAKNERLGPIFINRNNGEWAEHLATMKLFWSSVLLKTGKYKGNPVAKHNSIKELQSNDFMVWMQLFEHSAQKTFTPEAAPLVVLVAKNIANSLWLSKFGKIGESPPF